MSFRTKLLLACLPLALAPLAFFGLRARDEVTARLGAQYAARVEALARVIETDLEGESAAVAARLDRLSRALAADNRFRLALRDVRGSGADRAYLLDYAAGAMRLAGLDLLRIQDERGRVLSSGHFRNEYDAVDPALPATLRRAGARGVLVAVPTPTGPLLALARADSVRVGARTLTLVGGTAVDERFLDRLDRGTGLEVRLRLPAGVEATPGSVSADVAAPEPAGAGAMAVRDTAAADAVLGGGASGGAADRAATPAADAEGRFDPEIRDPPDAAPAGYARHVTVPFAGAGQDTVARFVVRASTGPLDALRREMDRWLLVTVAAAAGLALLLTLLVSARLGRPLAALARKAGRVDLDRLDVRFATGRADEIGALSRVLDRMTHRLRASAARLREAERRATIGEIARQVNHDIRNGLIPIRNVVRHLARLAQDRPDALPAIFLERRRTLESSVEYLHSLAGDYARLSPKRDPRPCDLNAIAREVVDDAASGGAARVLADLAPGLPTVHADPVALRRVVENLVVNAVESLEGDGAGEGERETEHGGERVDRRRGGHGGGRGGAPGGRVVVSTRFDDAGDPPRVLLAVADTGRGMTAEERARVFGGFYTTKPDGTGLGLSIVSRLVNDLGGRIIVDSEPGAGTRFTVDLPAGASGGPDDSPTGRPSAPRARWGS